MDRVIAYFLGMMCGMLVTLIILIRIPREVVSKTRIHPEVTVTIHPDSTIDSTFKYVQP